MTLVQPPMIVDGGRHTARAMRLMIRDLARGRPGVAEAGDLKVRPLETPGSAVRVGGGSALIHGARPWQGAYTQSNIGDSTVSVPATGPFSRTDLLILRVEDPEFEGERDPGCEDIGYFHLVQDVARDATDVPSGMTGIPLARLTLPRSTATVTADMITDLRQVATPRTERTLRIAHPDETKKLPEKHDRWIAWPEEAAWDVAVPDWATHVTLVLTVSGLRVEAGSIYAQMRTRFGERTAKPTVVDDDGTTTRRTTVVLADDLAVPAEYRGTRQHLAVQIDQIDKYGDGDLSVAKGTTVVAELEFTEGAV
ncbi:hypothetical protein ACFU99_24980 [Streptomyces sp. NPDC057654]|uniref:hypothetical protein n=1 Tax=Streptomyces sp. NPDC057654 TaxID=3346196 RepID=UPI0036A58FEC